MYFIKSDQSLRKHTLHLELDVYLYFYFQFVNFSQQFLVISNRKLDNKVD